MAMSVHNLFFKKAFLSNGFSVVSRPLILKNQAQAVAHRALSGFSFPLQQQPLIYKNIRPKDKQLAVTDASKIELKSSNKSDPKLESATSPLIDSQANETQPLKNSNVNKKSMPFKRRSGFDIPEEGDPDYDSWVEKIVQVYEEMHAHNAVAEAREAVEKQPPK